MKRVLAALLCLFICITPVCAQEQTGENVGPQITAPSAILMEASTGQTIYEKDSDSKRPPASVTKIMTLLLIFEALEDGKIQLDEEVVTSEYAASMGGSQVFLEPGEVQTVETLIKCISVASANDACVAMAEHICGSENEFVSEMNQKAQELGMVNTNFVNCNGLDAQGHVTTARDIALMSRELIIKHPEIREYCMIWQENITHTTKKGSTEFGLSNTNKLVRHYEYTTGLKTGSTSQAKFCISATAEKEGMELIAVIMAADDSKLRNKDATTLLNYGFSKCQKYENMTESFDTVEIKNGKQDVVSITQKEKFEFVDVSGADLGLIESSIKLDSDIQAPVKKGDVLGKICYYLGGKEIGTCDLIANENVERMNYLSALEKIMELFFVR